MREQKTKAQVKKNSEFKIIPTPSHHADPDIN